MKKIIVLFISLIIVSCVSHTPSQEAAVLFKNQEYDFGKISHQQEVWCSFQFTNQGDVPIIISDVRTSCGCTVSKWPQKPVEPDSSGEIIVLYDAAYTGIFFKEVKVYYNGPNSPVFLNIRGQVQ